MAIKYGSSKKTIDDSESSVICLEGLRQCLGIIPYQDILHPTD
ncbi:hypothetical protein [Oxynema aestuarii]|nr:hypothetical protein [Oxynema aestuarii]